VSVVNPPAGASVRSLIQERAEAALRMDADLPSPCISVCVMDQHSGLCIGCFRNIDEICAWSALGDNGKREVWRWIEQRSASA
jgi:predicted Fe-S protein YdhL (DUF1289 family)